MKNYFPPQNQNYTYLQTNRSDDLGSIWSSFNLDFQTNLGAMRLSNKLVTNVTSSDDADLGLPVAFEFWYDKWWAICGTRIFTNASAELTAAFAEETGIAYTIGTSTTQFDVTNPAGTTFRYTYDNTGTNPSITALTFPIGATVVITDTNLAVGNQGTFLVTGSGANYFEVTNAAGVVESNKTIDTGSITVTGGTFSTSYSQTTSDMLVFNDRLFVTNSTKLYYRLNNTTQPYTLLDTFSSLYVPHKMVYFKKFDRLYYIADSTSIRSVDNVYAVSTSGNYTLNVGKSDGWLSTMVVNSSFIWVASNSTTGDSVDSSKLEARISQWDGFSAQATNSYVITAAGVLAMCVLDDIPYAIDTEGRILKYTGYSFQEIARLPILRILLTNSSISLVNKWIHFNGFIATKNNTLQVLINNLNSDNGGTVNETLPSGIWELDLATNNFTHRYSSTLKPMASATITDYGQNRVSAVGALKLNTLQSSSANGRSTILAGLNYFTDATTIKSGIFIDSPASPNTNYEGQKRGYFVTTWFNSQEIQDKWARIWTTFRRFLASTDKMIYKYRLSEEDPILATITWVSTTQFTTTTNVSAYAPTQAPFNGTTGGEVEVLQGTGAGSCTHISSITELAGTYTVTLDTVVTGVTGTAKVRFQKWIKLFPEITGQVLAYSQLAIGESNTRIQVKCVMEFTGDDEFMKMALVSNEDIKINL